MMGFMPRVFLTTMTLFIGVALGTGAPMDLRAADWPTFGFNNLRQGNNPNETTLGPTNVQNLVAKWSFAAQGAITAQPVLAEGVSVNGTPMDLLFVGDNNGNLTYPGWPVFEFRNRTPALASVQLLGDYGRCRWASPSYVGEARYPSRTSV